MVPGLMIFFIQVGCLTMCPFFKKPCNEILNCHFKYNDICRLLHASCVIIEHIEILEALLACNIEPDSYNKYWNERSRFNEQK